MDITNSKETRNYSQSKYTLEVMKHNNFKLENHISTTKNQALLDQIGPMFKVINVSKVYITLLARQLQYNLLCIQTT